MSTGQKVALVVLILLALCLVIAVVLPGNDSRAVSPEDKSADPFRLLAGNPAAVAAGDLDAPCLVGNRLVFTGDCTLTVAASTESMRVLRLRPDRRVDVEAPAPKIDDFTIEARLKPGQEAPIAIDESGGVIELDCEASAGACTVLIL